MSVTIDGLEEAKDTFADLPQAFRDRVRDAIDVGSAIILTEAARRVPVGATGNLKRSLNRSIRGDGQEAIVAAHEFYAPFVEFGTAEASGHHATAAQPFLYPAFRLGAKYIRASMRDWAEDAGVQARFKTRRRKVKK